MVGLLCLWSAISAAEPNEPVGRDFHLTPDDLPPPFATPSVGNGSQYIGRPADATLQVPTGFRADLFRAGLRGPRWMAVAANGDVVLAETFQGRISVLRDADGDGAAELMETFSDEIEGPHGLAIHDGHLYVSDPTTVWRYAYEPGQLRRRGRAERVTPTGGLGDGGGHWTRNLAVSPDGRRLFVAIGSRGNIAEEPPPRATVKGYDLDGGNGRILAYGLRNPVGIAFHPTTADLYVVVNERDGLGDGLVPDYLTRITEGDFFGWPYAYIGANPDPTMNGRRSDLVAATKVPDVLFQSHSAPIGLVFYDGPQFPADYRGDAFVALRGSWNAAQPTGYKVVHVPFADGRPVGSYRNFVTGFWTAGANTAQVIGRPAGLAVARDGSLLIADDTGGAIWRVSYVGSN